MPFRISNAGPLQQEIVINATNIDVLFAEVAELLGTTGDQTTAIAVSQQPFLTGENYNTNLAGGATNSIDNIYTTLALSGLIDPIAQNRTITFNNTTTSTDLDLHLQIGGTNPQALTGVATMTVGGAPFVYPISNTKYNVPLTFTAMPAGVPPPPFNGGPTLVEFGVNQVWKGFTPEMRDTFDISTNPPGLGACCRDGPRSAAVAASRASGFTGQRALSYNFGVQMVPPVGGPIILPQAVTVICTDADGDCAQSVGFPNDTALPKQQTRDATGSYVVNFLDPVVSLS